MQTREVDVPEEILDLLRQSRLSGRAVADQVKSALAIHLLLEGVISVGKAAELSEVPRLEFESLLAELGLPNVWYERGDLDRDMRGTPGNSRDSWTHRAARCLYRRMAATQVGH